MAPVWNALVNMTDAPCVGSLSVITTTPATIGTKACSTACQTSIDNIFSVCKPGELQNRFKR